MEKGHFIFGVSNDLVGDALKNGISSKIYVYFRDGRIDAGKKVRNPSN